MGFSFLHGNRVEYGELNMRNILVTQASPCESAKLVVKVTDFGMEFVREEAARIHLTKRASTLSWIASKAACLVSR
jgi:hypothetical protein